MHELEGENMIVHFLTKREYDDPHVVCLELTFDPKQGRSNEIPYQQP